MIHIVVGNLVSKTFCFTVAKLGIISDISVYYFAE